MVNGEMQQVKRLQAVACRQCGRRPEVVGFRITCWGVWCNRCSRGKTFGDTREEAVGKWNKANS